MCEIAGVPGRLAIWSLRNLSEETVRFRFNMARILMEKHRCAEALAVLQDKRP
ncbi:hypothetical protein LCGC14_0799660 [marine sediment metagenome]|uniref:Uncharacterized protein n=1 Tax=marine sediment metagenome TaxID=412755 RepID=A0A0F9Q9W6_9ZZZZ